MSAPERARRGGAALLASAAAAAVLLSAAPAALAAHPTGRYLVVLKQGATARSAGLARLLERSGARRAGAGVPQFGIATVRGPLAAIRALRRDPSVRSVSAEWARDPRALPNDPALTQQDPDAPPGTSIQWFYAREGFPAAWDITKGDGAIVGVLDTGVDGSHPELRNKIASAVELGTTSGALHDDDGHGTHVSGLACAATNDGLTVAGAGWNCKLAEVKIRDFFDQEIIDGIRLAVDAGAQAINMSFGGGPPNPAFEPAFDYAIQHKVVLVGAASNNPDTDQGGPADQLQPGDAPDINAGRGLVVTGADASDRRAATGQGNQISIAAYGFYDGIAPYTGPIGLLSTFPANTTTIEGGLLGCGCRVSYDGDTRYAELEGTSMAAPQVSALAALIGNLNPFLSAQEKMRVIKETARRSGGWTGELGWGIIDAGRAVDAARRIDHVQPQSRARAAHRTRLRRGARRAKVRLRWRGVDPPGHAGLLPSHIRSYDVYLRRGRGRYRRVLRGTRRHSLLLRLRRGTYRAYTRAVDFAGNREPKPRRADVRFVVVRAR